MFTEEYKSFEPFAEAAFKLWAPDAEIIYTHLKSGYSGALVLKVDIRGKHRGSISNGQYILKLSEHSQWNNRENEIKAYNRAIEWDDRFARKHIPRLVASLDVSGIGGQSGYAMLYEIAGFSMDEYIATDIPESPGFFEISQQIVADTLSHWVKRDPHADIRPHELLEKWLGYRLDQTQAGALHSFVEEKMGSQIWHVEAGVGILNPLKFYELAKNRNWAQRGYFTSLLHGDFHGGNILVHRTRPRRLPYWIIDFGLSREGPAGYDQAYLEVAQIIYCLGERDPVLLILILQQLERNEQLLLPPGTYWLSNCLKKMRTSLSSWRDRTQLRRRDDVNRQLSLARVAAGINWANKKLDDNRRYLALCYAGWAARQYIESFEQEDWNSISSSTKFSLPSTTIPTVNSQSPDGALWEELWQTTEGFSPRSGKFVLVAEALGNNPQLRAVGQLPWSVVIDLDPYSDQSGLYHYASPVLQSHRSLHTFSQQIPVIDYSRGTAWMMAAGWVIKSENPTDYVTWVYNRLHPIRSFVKMFEDAVNPDPVYVVVMPGGSLDPDQPMARLSKIVSAIDEMTRGRAKIILLGGKKLIEQVQHLPVLLDVDTCLSWMATTFGVQAHTDIAEIPGNDGEWRPIPVDSLRAMQENLVVLHSNILNELTDQDGTQQQDSFWRGHPPTWVDFHAGLDIERSIHSDLMSTLREKLKETRNYTVVLYHQPGAGGTTAALRAAWDLHWEYPTAVLSHWSPALSTRLQNLYNIAQKPVLLIADKADLSETAREDLYRDLSQRNARIVVLYLRRVFQKQGEYNLSLYEPMKQEEAEGFLEAYASLSTDKRRRRELNRITYEKGLERYRSPFFYGLITFERDFLSVGKYVATHLQDVRRKAGEIVEYLALITIYSNTGLHEVLLKRLIGLTSDFSFEVSELLGDGPAHLVTARQGRIRLMHQIIAEVALSTLVGGGKKKWRLELPYLSMDFIRDVVMAVGSDSQIVLDMFRQLFVDRYGSVDDVEDKQDFSPLIEEIDSIDRSLGHQVLKTLTDFCPNEAHFWNHLGRHQIYRIQRDIPKAVEYLEQAVKLSPNDHVHYHTLGLVLRSLVRQTMHALKDQHPSVILESILGNFNRAVEAFERTRSIDPENMYSYITHVQMILEVAERLKKASNAENIAEIEKENYIVVEWLETNISQAEQLLNDANQLYGTLDQQDSYLTACYANLQKLYGDLDKVIQLWELANARGSSNATSRRALVNAYLARSNHSWSVMEVSELRRIVDLMEQNLRSSHRRDEDYRLWFEAYKLLPEFDVNEALSKLSLWASHFPSWRAYYYIYILNFHLWFSGRASSLDEMEEALEQCQKYVLGRKTYSSQWLGYSPAHCPLVSSNDLGRWNRADGFWEETDLLRPINGIIDDPIMGPQAGHIFIDGRVKAFFVPGKDGFSAHQDENTPVHFYIGFSPVGLRAWGVQRGRIKNGDRIPFGQQEKLKVPIHLEVPKIADLIKRERVRSLQFKRVMEFIHDMIVAKSELGAALALEELKSRVESAFGIDGIFKRLGMDDLGKLLEQTGAYRSTVVGNDILISLGNDEDIKRLRDHDRPQLRRETKIGQIIIFDASKKFGFIADGTPGNRWFKTDFVLPEYRKKLSKNYIVEFIPDSNDWGPIAISVRLLDEMMTLVGDRLIDRQELGKMVETEVLRILNDALISDQVVYLRDLHQKLSELFRGKEPLIVRLGVERISQFVRNIEGVTISGEFPNLIVKLQDERTFGRLPEDDERIRVAPSDEQVNAAKALVLQLVEKATAGGQEIKLEYIAHWLDQTLAGKGKVAQRLGYENLTQFLNDIPEVEVYGDDPTTKYVRLHSKNSGINGAEKSELFQRAKTLVLQIVEEAMTQGQSIKIEAVALRLGKALPGTDTVTQRLGYNKFMQFLNDIPEVEVYGDDPTTKYVRLSSKGVGSDTIWKLKASTVHKGEHADSSNLTDTDTITKSKIELIQRAKALVLQMVQKAAIRGQGIKITQLGHYLTPALPGTGKVAQRLGYEKFTQFLNEIPEIELYGDNPINQSVRLRFQGLENNGAQQDELFQRAKALVSQIVQEAAVHGQGVRMMQVAHRLTQTLPGTGKVAQRLGYETFTQFLNDIPEVETYGSATNLYIKSRI